MCGKGPSRLLVGKKPHERNASLRVGHASHRNSTIQLRRHPPRNVTVVPPRGGEALSIGATGRDLYKPSNARKNSSLNASSTVHVPAPGCATSEEITLVTAGSLAPAGNAPGILASFSGAVTSQGFAFE
eukprot:CAMPEP_0204446730 /NCGR_PEP_ID=MMETSP0470-20130426/95215_1 /ASSEMBLY_ACC=CAM_ASM_000385 /TAXON_ID=2969 /ORGANISM="Oxyrrhis marina" /LENGTH=128 /DNA_ID=CAMNT_0051446335 /DNA_START=77 /DNA_END=461 /DNA_ORIENTATION=+